jgi:hypothetical protein
MMLLIIFHTGQYEKNINLSFSKFLSHVASLIVITVVAKSIINTWKLITSMIRVHGIMIYFGINMAVILIRFI